MSDSIPTGKLKRASVAGLTAARIGIKQLGHLSKRPFLSIEKVEVQKKQLDDSNAEALFETLTHLRGTALKVAQMLSMETDLLPKRYRQELSKSYHQVPPLNRALIRKVVKQELGDNPEKIFTSFDSQAFAAASLGQVHAATSSDQQKLAIKVQYPGIGDTIHSDIQLVKQLTEPLPGSEVVQRVLEEIEARMQEETNYHLEAENIRWFDQHLKMDQVVLPAVFDNWSSKHLLCMQHLDGLHLKQWLQTNPTQAQRNHFAQIIYDLYIRSVFELHRLHADPNPGNYLFRDDCSLGLIDFGCIKQLTPEFTNNLSTLYKSIVHQDFETLLNTYREMEMLKSSSDNSISNEYFETVMKPFGQWVSKPFRQKSFDFSAHPGYAAEGAKLVDNIRRHRGFKGGYIELNTDFIFTDRTIYGLYKIFEEMGAVVRMQNRWTCQ